MTLLTMLLLGLFVALCVSFGLRRLILRKVGGRLAIQEAKRSAQLCKCGYRLGELDIARCPECGRVSGFDATPDELGLWQEELMRVQSKRRERAAESLSFSMEMDGPRDLESLRQ